MHLELLELHAWHQFNACTLKRTVAQLRCAMFLSLPRQRTTKARTYEVYTSMYTKQTLSFLVKIGQQPAEDVLTRHTG